MTVVAAFRRFRSSVLFASVAVQFCALAAPPVCQSQTRDAAGPLAGLPSPASRVVSLAPNITETLAAIGAADQVVGYSIFCKMQVKFPPRPVVGSFNQPDHDAIAAVKPEVVLFSEHAKPEDLRRLEAAGIRYLILPAGSIGEIVANVRLLGTLTGRAPKAEEVAGGIERIVAEARARSSALDPRTRPRVFLEVDGPDPYYTAGRGSFITEMVTLAGGVNVFGDRAETYPVVTPEEIIKADPEFVFVGGFNKPADEVRKRPGWDGISAVKSGKVYTGSSWELWLLLWRPGSSVGVTIQKLARELGTAPPESPEQGGASGR